MPEKERKRMNKKMKRTKIGKKEKTLVRLQAKCKSKGKMLHLQVRICFYIKY